MSDRDRANKNEIEIFVFSVASNDFSHDMLRLDSNSAADAIGSGQEQASLLVMSAIVFLDSHF